MLPELAKSNCGGNLTLREFTGILFHKMSIDLILHFSKLIRLSKVEANSHLLSTPREANSQALAVCVWSKF